MDNVINSILNIDSEAKRRLTEAEAKRNQIIADARAEEERIVSECITEADKRLKAIEDNERAEADRKSAAVTAERDKEIARLNEVFEKNHQAWENEIYNSVIGGGSNG